MLAYHHLACGFINLEGNLVICKMEVEDEYESLPANTPLGISMAAGAVAGIMEHTVMYPVDAIKTRMQVMGSSNIYKGVIHSLTRVSASEGAFALWRGMLSMIMGAGPAHAVHFAVYEKVISMQARGHDTNSPLVSAVAGAAATTCSDALMNPFDVIKQRMQLHGGSSLLRTAGTIYSKEGFKAFYVSYPTTLMMNVPFHVVNFSVYDTCSALLNPDRRRDPLSHCISGGIAGAAAAAISTPFDVVKTLLQTRGIATDPAARDLRGFVDACKYIARTQGLVGFFNGIKPRIVVNMPSTAICWTVYEMTKFYLIKTPKTGER